MLLVIYLSKMTVSPTLMSRKHGMDLVMILFGCFERNGVCRYGFFVLYQGGRFLVVCQLLAAYYLVVLHIERKFSKQQWFGVMVYGVKRLAFLILVWLTSLQVHFILHLLKELGSLFQPKHFIHGFCGLRE